MADRDAVKLLIYTCATKCEERDHTYALVSLSRSVVRALRLARGRVSETRFVFVGERPDRAAELLEEAGVEVETVPYDPVSTEPYGHDTQLGIGRMREIATDRAASWDADLVWSLDSDVLPKGNALRCMLDTLAFDGGDLYQVAFCPYPSQGGGSFLGGHGTPSDPILADYAEDEQVIDADLLELRERLRADLEKAGKARDQVEVDRLAKELNTVRKQIRGSRPKWGVFEANSKKWRRRGWFDVAYPALGHGAVVPVDWCGFGCTLMTRRAALLCDFTGYDGGGTEDLYIIWRRWHPAGIRIGCIPHCPADHVIRRKMEDGTVRLVHLVTGHEAEGEMRGHLRQVAREWRGS